MLPGGRELDVKVPAGIQEGQIIRLRGQGRPAGNGRAAGDTLLKVRYETHQQFRVEGRDLVLKLDVPLTDAYLGGTIRVPTLTGAIEMNIPPETDGGRTFRLRGKGLPKPQSQPDAPASSGDLLVNVNIILPRGDGDLEAVLRKRRDFTV